MKALSQPLFASLRGYDRQQLGPDLFSGVLIALLSIPISMGYAQLAGLPPVYGLYGSLIPILLFAMLSTTREFIFGVDAAPAAMIGAVLASLGVTAGSAEAMRIVPVLTLYVAAVAGSVRARARGQGRRLHLRARHGRVHQRRLLRDHPHAGAEAARLRHRHGRALRAAGAHL